MPGPQRPELSPHSLPPVPGRDTAQLTGAELGPGSPPWGGESPGDLSPQAEVSEAPALPFCSHCSVNVGSSQRVTPSVAALLSSVPSLWGQAVFLGDRPLVSSQKESQKQTSPSSFRVLYSS